MPIILPKSNTPRDHLILPDDHAYPEDNFRRYEWLGQFILEKQPEVIVKLGDSWDMPSLCSYDKGKKDFVFRSLKEDIEAGHTAESIMFGPMLEYNDAMRKAKKKQYTPLVLKLIGNHEHRLKRLLDYEPQWQGTVSMDCFKTRLPLNEVIVDYLDFAVLDDIAYSHYFVSGTQGRPFSSARAMLTKKGMSCTMGHTHTLDTASLTKPTGELIRAVVAGSFHDPDHESFAGKQVDNVWWNGILYKHQVLNGSYDLEEISVTRLQKEYGQ